jgi:hypothetical protein
MPEKCHDAICRQGAACHIRDRSAGHRGQPAVTSGEVELLGLPGNPPSAAHPRMIDLWSCVLRVDPRPPSWWLRPR